MACHKLYHRKSALVATDTLNDRILPFFEEDDVPLPRILTDRGTEYCGKQEHHEYQLYLGIENIDHSKTKARSRQSNGICERFYKTVLDEFYRGAFRRKSTISLTSCRPIWILGSTTITKNMSTAANTVLEKRRCKHFWIRCRW